MSLVSKIQSYFFNSHLNKKLSQKKSSRSSAELDGTESIGILFDATDAANRNRILDYAENLIKNGKKVKLLGFVKSKQKNLSLPFKFFTLQDISWKMIPESIEVNQFLKKRFDILINLYQGHNLPIEYISALSKSNLRVGPFSKNANSYDLMIDTPSGSDLEHLIKQIDFFLNKINSPIYEPVL